MATTTNFGWTTPDNTALVKDGALAIRTLGSAIDTSMGDLRGGTTGQILAKNTNADMDFVWIANDQGDITAVTAGTGISGGGTTGAVTITNSMATAIDAKGDLIAGTAADTFDRLAVGTNGHVLTADSTTATGLRWAAPVSGKILQVIQTTKTDTFSTTSATYTDITGMSVSITPSATTSRIMIIAQISAHAHNTTGPFTLLRGSTEIFRADAAGSRTRATTASAPDTAAVSLESSVVLYVDSPSTTSSTTYKIQTAAIDGGGTVFINRSQNDFDASNRPRGASSIIVMEIGA